MASLYEDILLRELEDQGDESYKNTLSQIKSYQKRIDAAGYEAPAPESPGFIQTFFETIDKPRGALAGGIANLVGIPGYQNDFVGAVSKGWKKPTDIGGSDFLKAAGLTGTDWGSRIARGVGGFGIDVITDPLNAITLGGGSGAKLAGKTLSKGLLKTVNGELKTVEELIQAAHQKEWANGLEALAKGASEVKDPSKLSQYISSRLNVPIEDVDTQIGRLNAKASLSANRKAQDLAALVEEQNAYQLPTSIIEFGKTTPSYKADMAREAENLKAQFGQEAADALLKGDNATIFNLKSNFVKKNLDIANEQDISNLFQKSGVRFNLKNIPLVGDLIAPALAKDYMGDIPVITDLTGALLGGIGKVSKVGNRKVDELLQWGSNIDGAASIPFKAVKAVKGAPKLISRSLQAGSKLRGQMLKDYEVQRSISKQIIEQDAEIQFRYATPDGKMAALDDETLQRGSEIIQSGFDDALTDNFKKNDKGFWAHIDATKQKAKFNEQAFLTNLDKEAAKLNALTPGKGNGFKAAVLRMRADLDNWATKEVDEGVLDNVREGYLTGIYKDKYGNAPDVNLAKKFTTLSEARAAGFNPETNLKEIWKTRKFQHEKALNEKELMHRLFMDFGLNGQTKAIVNSTIRSSLVDLAKNSADATAKRRLNEVATFMGNRGFAMNPSEVLNVMQQGGEYKSIADAADPIFGIARLDKPDGMVNVSLEYYDRMAQALRGELTNVPGVDQGDNIAVLVDDAKRLGINGSKEERQAYAESWAQFGKAASLAPDVFGEKLLSKIGAAQMPNRITKFLDRAWKNGKVKPDVVDFYKGDLPENLVRAAKESLDLRSTTQKLADASRSLGDTHLAQSLEAIGGMGLQWLSWLKQGATKYWPAYHVRNMWSANFQAMHAAQNIGAAINPASQVKLQYFLHSPNSAESVLKLKNGERLTRNQFLAEAHQAGIIASSNAVSDTIDLMKDVGEAQKTGVLSKIDAAVSNFGKGVENHGRLHLYWKLRRDGLNPAQAAEETNRALIDYAHGKTDFEKHILNNVIFFYSFLRGETANTLTSMLSRPGVLSTQYQAHKGVASILADPSNSVTDEEKYLAQTSRTKDALSAILGKNEKGDPIVLTSTGIPAEEAFRNMGLRMPADTTPESIAQALFDTSKSFMRNQLSSVNPILRKPIEIIANKSFYFDRPLTDSSLRKFPNMAMDSKKVLESLTGKGAIPEAVYTVLDGATKAFLGGKDNGDGTYTVSPTRLAMLSFIPGVDRAVSSYNTARKAVKSDKGRAGNLGRLVTGVRTLDVDINKSIAKDRARQLEAFISQNAIPSQKKSRTREMLLDLQDL